MTTPAPYNPDDKHCKHVYAITRRADGWPVLTCMFCQREIK